MDESSNILEMLQIGFPFCSEGFKKKSYGEGNIWE